MMGNVWIILCHLFEFDWFPDGGLGRLEEPQQIPQTIENAPPRSQYGLEQSVFSPVPNCPCRDVEEFGRLLRRHQAFERIREFLWARAL
jgi:hypothetical protein